MATVWDGAESANQELGAEKRGNTESGKQIKVFLSLSRLLTEVV